MAEGAYAGWAIVELMGHRRIAGEVATVAQFGVEMLRVDIPTEPPMTQFYGGSAIYCLTPCSEAVARGLAPKRQAAVCHLLDYAGDRPDWDGAFEPGAGEEGVDPRDGPEDDDQGDADGIARTLGAA